jgi:hypothetical protein
MFDPVEKYVKGENCDLPNFLDDTNVTKNLSWSTSQLEKPELNRVARFFFVQHTKT